MAILTVSDSVGKPLWVSSRGGGRRRSRRAQQVRGTITLEAAKRLAASCGLKKALDMPAEGATYAKATRPKRRGSGKVVVARESAANGVPNVVGLLEGSEDVLVTACARPTCATWRRRRRVWHGGVCEPPGGELIETRSG